MRSWVQDVTGRALYDEYHLTFSYICWTDSLTTTQFILDQIY